MKINNNEDIFKAFDKLDKDLHIELVSKIANDALKYSKEFAKPNHKTGQMERELSQTVTKDDEAYIIAGAPHTVFIHFGTKPHTVEAKNGSYLRWAGGARFKYRKKVYSSGFKGNPFIYDGIKKAFSNVDKYLDEVVE